MKTDSKNKATKKSEQNILKIAKLSERVTKSTKVDEEKVKQIINAFFDVIKNEVVKTGFFKLQGLGTFNKVLVPEKEHRNPRSGESVIVAEHNVIKFSPSSTLAIRINKPYSKLKPKVIEEAKEEIIIDNNSISSEKNTISVPEDFVVAPDSDVMMLFNSVTPMTKTKYEDYYNKDSNEKSSEEKTSNIKHHFDNFIADRNFNLNKDEENINEYSSNTLQQESIIDDIDATERFFDEFVPKENDDKESDNNKQSNSKDDFSTVKTQLTKKENDVKERDFLQIENDYMKNDYKFENNINRNDAMKTPDRMPNQIIEHQVIHHQIIQNHYGSTMSENEDDLYTTESEDDIQRYISRCWFFAGVAVVVTAIMICALAFVLMSRKNVSSTSNNNQAIEFQFDENDDYPLQISAKNNVYASLAQSEYGEKNLWPYICSANLLRFPDPDKPGFAGELIVPIKPDKKIDKKDIELSVIDVYDAYRSLISKNKNAKISDTRRENAITALICGQSLYSDFLDKYYARFEQEDVDVAQDKIKKAMQ